MLKLGLLVEEAGIECCVLDVLAVGLNRGRSLGRRGGRRGLCAF